MHKPIKMNKGNIYFDAMLLKLIFDGRKQTETYHNSHSRTADKILLKAHVPPLCNVRVTVELN